MDSMGSRFVAMLCLLWNLSHAQTPRALNVIAHVDPGKEVEIQLLGYDVDGLKIVPYITSLPTSGTLHQLTQVYSDYGYEPKAGSLIQHAPTRVNDSKYRVIYKRPTTGDAVSSNKYDNFSFMLGNTNRNSTQAIVTVLCSSTLTSVSSTFDRDTEGWSVTGETPSVLKYYPFSNNQMNRYIGSSATTGDDQDLWYFNAPEKFLGNQWESYGGMIQFCLASSHGEFSVQNLNQGGNSDFVILNCVSCNKNKGIKLVRKLDETLRLHFMGTCHQLKLTETSGWLKEPGNGELIWSPPSQCEMVDVLSNLSTFQILGDFTKWYESVDLDNVAFRAGSGIPWECSSSE